MKILAVCREIPYPLNAGYKIRTFNLLKRLARSNSVSLLCYGQETECREARSVLESFLERVQLVSFQSRPKLQQIPFILGNLLAGQPPMCVKYVKSKQMQQALQNALAAKEFDLVHFDDPYIVSNHDFSRSTGAKITVTFHDVDSRKYQRFFAIEKNPYKKAMLLFDLFMLRRWERYLVSRSDLNIVMSDVDRLTLTEATNGTNIAVVPNGVDTELISFREKNKPQETVSYFGTMDYMPNHDAALYFYREIFPLIRERKPGVRFRIIGRNPSRELMDLARDPGVEVTGNVPDVIPYYHDTSVAAVPLRAGGGTRLKILEAMAVGCPVVSTSIGAEGIDVRHGSNILIADEPEEFAQWTIELLTDEKLRRKLAANARRFVEDRYSWQGIGDRLNEIYRSLVDQQIQVHRGIHLVRKPRGMAASSVAHTREDGA
ncbi:glycosyltransferase family 4 protein [Geobacter sp. DSM 9736]|uniref:glycosyltransferase family 4 protein n=1 Tax=Geobacter sp. DSM 9736 TaxID=1277350 RepID=UPI000B5E2AEC|nr:glycosyltransferase family 4 protein [Geobacter sp. DSM 9736]SNB46132.1 sugar transferase, PEP-CTERM/EpsH1 system associated [Geobacter sp. DSM 9736]